MVSRDTTVHVAIVLLVVAAVVGVELAAPDLDSTLTIVLGLLGYALILGGSHLLLAWREEGEMIPVSSRWRFVAFVAFVVAVAGVSLLTDPVDVGGVSSDTILTAVTLLALVGYWVSEARSGYREASGS